MQTLEILVEENAFGAVRQVEVFAEALVSTLVTELVKELELPQTDLFGNRLVYMLRYAPEGPILPEEKSLGATGIKTGTRLALNSYVMNGSVAALMNLSLGEAASDFHASMTLADGHAFAGVGKDTSGRFPIVKKERRWTRRGFLALGAALGASGVGYAVFQTLIHHNQANTNQMSPVQSTHAKAFVPSMAKKLVTFTQHQQRVRSLSWSPDGTTLASGADDKRLFLWHKAGTISAQLPLAGAVRALAWSPDGQLIAAGAANSITFLNALTGVPLAQTSHHTAEVTSLAWSPQQPLRLASGALDKQVIIWNATTHMPQTIFTRHTTPIEAVSWSADGQTVASSSHGGAIRIWNATSGIQVHDFFLDAPIPMHALAFAPTGTRLAVGGDDGIVRLWDGLVCQLTAHGKFGNQCEDLPQRLHAHSMPVRALSWSPDARFLATGGDDGMLAIWQPAQSQAPLLTIAHPAPVLALKWSRDGREVATASGNVVTIWELR